MATTPAHRNRRQAGAGVRFLPIGLTLIAIGLVIVLLAEGGLTDGIGAAFMIIGALPTVVGLVLLGSSLVERRERHGRPWA
jgi:hypothetical protein